MQETTFYVSLLLPKGGRVRSGDLNCCLSPKMQEVSDKISETETPAALSLGETYSYLSLEELVANIFCRRERGSTTGMTSPERM